MQDDAETMMPNRVAWIFRMKLKVLAYLAGIVLATVGTVSLAGVPWLPAVGVAVCAAAVSVGKATGRLGKPTCLSCGSDLSGQPIGAHGMACGECGSVHQPSRGRVRG